MIEAKDLQAPLGRISRCEIEQMRGAARMVRDAAPVFCGWFAFTLFSEGRRRDGAADAEAIILPMWHAEDIAQALVVTNTLRAAFRDESRVSEFLAGIAAHLTHLAAAVLLASTSN